MAANPETVSAEITLTEARTPIGAEGVADLARRAADLNKTIRDLATHPNHRKTLRKFVGPEVAALLDLKVETLYRRLDRNPELPRSQADRARCQPLPAAGGPIGLGDRGQHLGLGRQPAQRRDRERAGPEKYSLQRVNAASASARSSSVSAGRTFFALSM